jgi:triosephosphate isomerase
MVMLVANWKMNGTGEAARAYAFAINHALQDAPAALQVVFCPPSLYLSAAQAVLPQNARLALGAQNCHHEAQGAFTGEISAAMLRDVGARYVILGHSERRVMGEGDAEVLAKAQSAQKAGLTPILCVGESRRDYEAGKTLETLRAQLECLKLLDFTRARIAYEPIWAIGSQQTPAPTEIQAAHACIKSVLGSATVVLYGGSVNAANIAEILALPEVSGALIGGASVAIESMCAVLNAVRA